jgi:hypothetical protein
MEGAKIKRRMDSLEVARTAIFSSVLTVVDVIIYHFTWPMLPPILLVPFINCLFFGMTLPFSRHQWMMGLIASIVTILSTGVVLPGPFILPVYGFAFQTRKVKFSGAFASVTHMFYGVFLAPFIFSVAPAKIVYDWLLLILGDFAPAIIVITLVFIAVGVVAGSLGYRVALRIAGNLKEGSAIGIPSQ